MNELKKNGSQRLKPDGFDILVMKAVIEIEARLDSCVTRLTIEGNQFFFMLIGVA